MCADCARRRALVGLDAQKANILAAKTVAKVLRTSLGPKGMDKMLQSPDGDVTISTCARGSAACRTDRRPR